MKQLSIFLLFLVGATVLQGMETRFVPATSAEEALYNEFVQDITGEEQQKSPDEFMDIDAEDASTESREDQTYENLSVQPILQVQNNVVEKNRICHICSKTFTGPYGLKIHLRIHTKEKPYVCTVCSFGFTQKCQLNQHIRCVHEKLTPFVCALCNKKYRRKHDLQKHIKTHQA